MPTIDSIFPAANTALNNDNTPPASSGALIQTDEPFDHLMTRALSPSDTDATIGRNQPAASGAKKHSSAAAQPLRRRPQAQSAANENAAPAAGKAPDASLRPTDKSSDTQKSEVDTDTGSINPNETQAASSSLSGNLIPLLTALSAGIFPLSLPAAKNIAKPAIGTTAIDPAVIGPLAVDAGMKKSSPGAETAAHPTVLPDPVSADLIHHLKPDGQQKVADGNDHIAPGKPDADSVKAGQLMANNLKASEFPANELTSLKTTPEPAVHLLPSEVPAAKESNTGTLTPAQSDTRGTPAAKLYMSMNKTEKMNKVAGSTEKVLPVEDDSTAQENILPTNGPRNGQAVVIIGPPTKGPESMDVTSSANGVAASAAVDLRSRAIERTHDMIALQGMRLIDSQSDALRVVIKPGAGMQLSLELRQHGDGIDAQVILQRGDFSSLSQHWPDLQHRLEQRGIRLAPLTGSENSVTDGGSNAFQQPRRDSANPDPLSASAFAEFALAQPTLHPSLPSTTFATPHRGWETWA